MAKRIKKPERLEKKEFKDKLPEILGMLQAESERGSALLAGALIDDVLVTRLRELLVPDEKEYKSMTGVDRPLGTYSSRVTMGYLLGMYGPKFLEMLRRIGDIRNAFAHYHQVAKFSDPEIAKACLSLFPAYVEAVMEDSQHPTCTDPRRRFQACVGWIIVDLLYDRHKTRQPSLGLDYYDMSGDEGFPRIELDLPPSAPHIMQDDP
jgi:hypothetical protein